MSRVCSICTHPLRDEIDVALASCNGSIRGIAARFPGITATSLARHKDAHLPAALVASEEAREVVQAVDLFAQTEELHVRAMGLLTKAEKAGDIRGAAALIHAAKGCLELSAKMRATAWAIAEREPRLVTVEDVDRTIAYLEAQLESA